MTKGRLEAFSDGVIAIIITVMVLELKVPHGDDFQALVPMIPLFAAYVLSFVHVGIYWNNHHHMLAVSEHVNGKVLWANLHLLFWMSLIPVTTAWMGETRLAPIPTSIYGVDLLATSLAYFVLARTLVRTHGRESKLARSIGGDRKGQLSSLLYAVGTITALYQPYVGAGLYVVVALIWLVPDRRIESKVSE